MANLSDLPPELVLKVLSFLPIQSLHTTILLSRLWYQFSLEHEDTIYRHAACYHQFIPSMNVPLSEAKLLYSSLAITSVNSWRNLCQRLCRLHLTWAGCGDVASRVYFSAGKKVHRIKVDERIGIVITSHATGGILVTDLQTDKLLWSLDNDYVRSWAHVEYGNGFLVFDRFGEYKEVWRLATDGEGLTPPTTFPPDSQQVRRSVSAGSRFTSTDKRGHFEPWALLVSPEWGRAFRFVYPTLLVGSFSKAYLFNVESARLVQIIEDTQQQCDSNSLGEIHYVEVNEQHVFICGSMELRIFNRADGRLVFRMNPNHVPPMTQMMVPVPVASTRNLQAKLEPLSLQPDHQTTAYHHYFIAVHVWGSDLVVLKDDAQVIFIKDYRDAIANRRPLSELAVLIKIKDPSSLVISHLRAVYMAFEHGRVAVVTTVGVFVFTMDATIYSPDLHLSPSSQTKGAPLFTLWGRPLSILCCHVLSLEQPGVLGQVTCLQMTESKLLLAYHPGYAPENWPQNKRADTNAVAGPSTATARHLTNEAEGEEGDVPGSVPTTHADYLELSDNDDDDWIDDDTDDDWDPELRSVVCINFSP